MKQKHPNNIKTKIVGVQYEGRQDYLVKCKEFGISVLHLKRDPHNRYDTDAIGVWANILDADGNVVEELMLGHISNSDRFCLGCGAMVDGQTFNRTKQVKCPGCKHVYSVPLRDASSCPRCSKVVEFEMNKTLVCTTCCEDEFFRDGLASNICRTLEENVSYVAEVMDWTGGDINQKTHRRKTLGCNIKIVRLEAEQAAA